MTTELEREDGDEAGELKAREAALGPESIAQTLVEWQRATEEMGDSLSGVFELSDEVAALQLK